MFQEAGGNGPLRRERCVSCLSFSHVCPPPAQRERVGRSCSPLAREEFWGSEGELHCWGVSVGEACPGGKNDEDAGFLIKCARRRLLPVTHLADSFARPLRSTSLLSSAALCLGARGGHARGNDTVGS